MNKELQRVGHNKNNYRISGYKTIKKKMTLWVAYNRVEQNTKGLLTLYLQVGCRFEVLFR